MQKKKYIGPSVFGSPTL